MAIAIEVLAVNCCVAGICIFMVLYTLAVHVGWERQLRQLRLDAIRLREAYERRIQALRAGEAVSDEPIEVDVAHPRPKSSAA